MIFHKFETLECDLEKIRKIIKIVVNNAHEFMTCELKKVNFWINSEHSKDFLNQVAEYGPLSEQDIKTKI